MAPKTCSPLMPLTPNGNYMLQQGDSYAQNPMMISKIYKPTQTMSRFINNIINPGESKASGQLTPSKVVASPTGAENNTLNTGMRKLNVSGMLDRHTSNHVTRIDSQIQGINQIWMETNMATNQNIFND